VVLLHGSTSSSCTWWHVGPRLAESDSTVTAFDLPSHGSSPAARAPLTPQVAAAAVEAEIRRGTVDVLLGHSFGAAVATTLVAANPGLARHIVLEELPEGVSPGRQKPALS
jgi:pimeloyl-ACP methyl ester carboxylesterase